LIKPFGTLTGTEEALALEEGLGGRGERVAQKTWEGAKGRPKKNKKISNLCKGLRLSAPDFTRGQCRRALPRKGGEKEGSEINA